MSAQENAGAYFGDDIGKLREYHRKPHQDAHRKRRKVLW